MSNRRCELCDYWSSYGTGIGECRRKAPSVEPPRNPPEPDTRKFRLAVWPQTTRNHWCGEGEFRPEPLAERATDDR